MYLRGAVWVIPGIAAAVGLAVMVVATGGAAWATASVWVLVAAAIGAIEATAHTKRTRVFVPLVAILTLPILVFEGGLFLWPAAVALLAAAVIAPEPRQRTRRSASGRTAR
jgi:hypothetical protein